MDDRQDRSTGPALRRAPWWPALAALAFTLICCSGPGQNVKVRPLAGLLVQCEPGDAVVYVDDKYMGSVKGLDTRPLMLPEGDHRVEVRKDGYFAHFTEVKMVKGVRQQLKVKLRKEPF